MTADLARDLLTRTRDLLDDLPIDWVEALPLDLGERANELRLDLISALVEDPT